MAKRSLILAGDIGGTKTVLALYEKVSGRLRPVRQQTYQSGDFLRFQPMLRQFLAGERPGAVRTICIGAAGPIRNGRCKTTNLPWELDERSLARGSGVKTARLFNDLEAMAYGMLFLPKRDWVTLNPGSPGRMKGHIAVIAAGTGLGQALLFWNGKEYQPIASEGGHVEFGPQSEREVELLRYLRAEYGHVSYERVLSGPGLYNIYRFLRDTGFAPEPDWLREKMKGIDPAPVITEIGLSGGDALCTEALNIFVSIYGAEAGNLALKGLTLGGVCIGGGIAPQILDKLREGAFMQRFLDKGRYTEILSEIPVRVSLNRRTALLGAAHLGLRL